MDDLTRGAASWSHWSRCVGMITSAHPDAIVFETTVITPNQRFVSTAVRRRWPLEARMKSDEIAEVASSYAKAFLAQRA